MLFTEERRKTHSRHITPKSKHRHLGWIILNRQISTVTHSLISVHQHSTRGTSGFSVRSLSSVTDGLLEFISVTNKLNII